MFKKKKAASKEKSQEGQSGETASVEEGTVALSGDESEEKSVNKNNASNVDLKTALFFVATAIIAILCAFVSVSHIVSTSTSNDVKQDELAEESGSVTKDADVSQNRNKKKETEQNGTREVKQATAGKKNSKETDNSEEGAVQGNIIVPLESIVVNLGGVGSRRYLRVLINLEVESVDDENMIKEKIVMLRDKMISLLSAKTAKEIEAEGSLLRLRLEIKNVLNEVLGVDETIKTVYFSDFIIQ